ncbi:MAG: insulinase family protein [Hyphomicrobiaceae bacterium]|nr:insulinase family protein [Hyphomicrobiaceae bacterium]MCC0008630.1 insulinase family protein [Hyphomicrobiaceae bacterium]
MLLVRMVPSRTQRLARGIARLDIAVSIFVLALALGLAFSRPASAMKIQTIKSPGGIEAWLVEEHSVPLVAMRFAFRGGSAQDPDDKSGLANFMSAMLDEGAGDLTSSQFQERQEELAMRMSYSDSRDAFSGNFESLTENLAESVALLRLAINKPRFDADAVERIRKQLLSNLVYSERDPDKVAAKSWFESAFPGHPYGRSASGTAETINAITGADLEAYRKRTFARENLEVAVVGDIDAESLGKLLDEIFGDLPAKPELKAIAETAPVKGGVEKIVEMSVPQSVAVFGLPSVKRKDPDFMAAFVLNHILGGGGFASQLMEEVREKRGLAYSVYSYLMPEDHAAVMLGSVATKNESIGESLGVIRDVLKRMAGTGPTATELENAKRYLVGSYALRFDTSGKIASQLLGLQLEDFGPDYVENRNALIEAVTLDDIKRVAARWLDPSQLIVTVVGKPTKMDADGRSFVQGGG